MTEVENGIVQQGGGLMKVAARSPAQNLSRQCRNVKWCESGSRRSKGYCSKWNPFALYTVHSPSQTFLRIKQWMCFGSRHSWLISINSYLYINADKRKKSDSWCISYISICSASFGPHHKDCSNVIGQTRNGNQKASASDVFYIYIYIHMSEYLKRLGIVKGWYSELCP